MDNLVVKHELGPDYVEYRVSSKTPVRMRSTRGLSEERTVTTIVMEKGLLPNEGVDIFLERIRLANERADLLQIHHLSILFNYYCQLHNLGR